MSREVLLVVHTGRKTAVAAARDLAQRLSRAGLVVRALPDEAAAIGTTDVVCVELAAAAVRAELVIACGGDGTLLRAAELARPAGAALLGINLGRVGFLAEADRADLDATVTAITSGGYDVEPRLTIDLVVRRDGAVVATDWALNDVSVEKAARHRMLEVQVSIDGRPLSQWNGDGVVCATPTGSTAYAFSAGGPIVWPAVQALLLVPLSAHALFARPLVVAPDSAIVVDMRSPSGVAFCDGRRTIELTGNDRLEICRGKSDVRLVRLDAASFTDRLVRKFRLPVSGWRDSSPAD
jgi:NAD+ kinase